MYSPTYSHGCVGAHEYNYRYLRLLTTTKWEKSTVLQLENYTKLQNEIHSIDKTEQLINKHVLLNAVVYKHPIK